MFKAIYNLCVTALMRRKTFPCLDSILTERVVGTENPDSKFELCAKLNPLIQRRRGGEQTKQTF